MAQINTECEIFDPIKFTTKTRVNKIILDTWFDQGLISRSLFERLPGLEINRSSKVYMSSGMYVNQPEIQIGLQINNLRALPITVNVIENGPADLLLGSDFIKLLFDLGKDVSDLSEPHISYEPLEKFSSESLGLRIYSEAKTIDSLELENFLQSLRKIHNVAIIATTKLHQHKNWNTKENQFETIRKTINYNYSLSYENSLQISWTGTGSIWVNLKSGSKKAFSWLSQLFHKSMDARLRETIANAVSAEEDAEIKKLTREEIINAKKWEQRRIAAENFRKANKEWQETIVAKIDFQKKLTETIHDPKIREAVYKELDNSVSKLLHSKLFPLVENLPVLSEEERDHLPIINNIEQQGGNYCQ